MTGKELKQARARLGLSQAGFAVLLRVEGKDRTIRKWENDERAIPGSVGLLVEILLDLCGTDAGKKYGV